jgi:hypothetical protein
MYKIYKITTTTIQHKQRYTPHKSEDIYTKTQVLLNQKYSSPDSGWGGLEYETHTLYKNNQKYFEDF